MLLASYMYSFICKFWSAPNFFGWHFGNCYSIAYFRMIFVHR